jgi:hypothetical protein
MDVFVDSDGQLWVMKDGVGYRVNLDILAIGEVPEGAEKLLTPDEVSDVVDDTWTKGQHSMLPF